MPIARALPDVDQDEALAAEALRQQRLLRVLWRRTGDADLCAGLRDTPQRQARGLAAYRGNAEAIAARALAAAFPTVAALVGDDAFGAIARAHWLRHPPRRGDLALFGDALPDALATDAQLADLPYLADVARLDWAIQRCESAADSNAAAAGLERLGEADPARLRLVLRPGLALLASAWPIVTILQAHRPAAGDADPFAPARAALARGDAETAIVWRHGWRAQVERLTPADARFTAAVLAPLSLADALDAAGAAFDFEPWLVRALRDGWLGEVVVAGESAARR